MKFLLFYYCMALQLDTGIRRNKPEAGPSELEKPALIVRIKSTLIDTFVVVLLMWLSTIVLQAYDTSSGVIRGLAFGIILMYEPVAINKGKTLGQLIMGLRVSDEVAWIEYGKIQQVRLLPAILRSVLKITLGWLSLVTIHVNPLGQAIHDQAASSIVFYDEPEDSSESTGLQGWSEKSL